MAFSGRAARAGCHRGWFAGVLMLAMGFAGLCVTTTIGSADEGARPSVRALPAREITETSVWLGGEVNPRGSPTGFLVEYTRASDIAFEHGVLVPPEVDIGEAGQGERFVVATQLVMALRPDTAYRFRLVATSPVGTTKGPAGTFVTRKGRHPAADPDRRSLRQGGEGNVDPPKGAMRMDSARVYRVVRGYGQIVLYLPSEVERPTLTSDHPYLRVACFAARGRLLFRERQSWPNPQYHVHVVVPARLVRQIARCRATGTARPLELRVRDGAADGAHPTGSRDPTMGLDPLRSAL